MFIAVTARLTVIMEKGPFQDSNSSTVSLKPTVPGEAFLDIFDRWYRGFTGIQNGLNEGHKRSIGHMLKIRDGVVTWVRSHNLYRYGVAIL